MAFKLTVLNLTVITFLLAGCAGKAPEPATASAAAEESSGQEPENNIQVKGLWGKIDDSIVEETFSHHLKDFLTCYQYEGLEILEEIEGDLSVYLIVGPDGRATDEVYFESGNLGSDPVQDCIISKIKNIKFPNPIGGYNAKVRYSIPFEAPYDNPKPFDWSGARMEAAVADNRDAVEACLNGSQGVTLTLYVGRGGRVVAAGGAGSDLNAYKAARCLSAEVQKWKFKNPGKYRPAKATIQF